VREAAQNSWDAREGTGEVEFSIDLRRLGDRAGEWSALLLPGPVSASVERFDRALEPERWVIVVSDRGTVGLGGPSRANERPVDGERNDFVQFLRNVGEPRDTDFGGGTYGFGKGIFYRISGVHSILVDTNAQGADGPIRRLMGAALGDDYFDEAETRFTGRHWWGTVAADGIPDPVVGVEAAEMSERLGLPGFSDGRNGTDIVILCAELGDEVLGDLTLNRDPREAAHYLASSVLWHLWPKLLPGRRRGGRMKIRVALEGEDIEIPNPRTVLELMPFAASLTKVRDGHGSEYKRTRPSLVAGQFSSEQTSSRATEREVVQAAKPFDGAPHHVARMRSAELVVDYFEGPVHPDPLFGYGGVFRATETADQYFADAEPPTHDAWVEAGLSGDTKSIVLGSRSFIRGKLASLFVPAEPGPTEGSSGLGALAAKLASLVPKVHSTAATPAGSPPTGSGGGPGAGGARTASKPKISGDPWLGFRDGVPLLFINVDVPASDSGWKLRADVDVVVDGGARESLVPSGASTPHIVDWIGPDRYLAHGEVAAIAPGASGQWVVSASYSDDVVARFRVSDIADA